MHLCRKNLVIDFLIHNFEKDLADKLVFNNLNLVTMKNVRENQPTIVRYVEAMSSGIKSYNLSRCAIGFVLRGSKHIYNDDTNYVVSRGDVFFLGIGTHYIENIPEGDKPFEQVVFYYSASLIQRILLHLSVNYSLNITNTHRCEHCKRVNHVATVATYSMRSFFSYVLSDLRDERFVSDETVENIKMTELIYLIISQIEGCLKSKIMYHSDSANDNFEQVIYANIFRDLSIEQLSSMTNRSLTSFKKEFRRHFDQSPHRWFINQRLQHSRLLLVSTTKSISEIGNECAFPNTSHFIKLFKKRYELTPALYRHQHLNVQMTDQTSEDVRQASGDEI